VLFVAACAYVAAVFLVGDARRRGQPDMVGYFSRRAIPAGLLTGALAAADLALLRDSGPYLFDRLTGTALPLVAAAGLAGATALGAIALRRPWQLRLRVMAAVAVACIVGGWGWAQYPYLLPTQLSLTAGSAPVATLRAELAVIGLAALIVGPAYVYLLRLQQRDLLQETPTSAELRRAATQNGAESDPASAPAGRRTPSSRPP